MKDEDEGEKIMRCNIVEKLRNTKLKCQWELTPIQRFYNYRFFKLFEAINSNLIATYINVFTEISDPNKKKYRYRIRFIS